MNQIKNWMIGLCALAGSCLATEVELQAAKDTFGRSNKFNNNNGASEHLYIAQSPIFRTLIAFDLSGITNQINGAEFRFRQHNSMPDPINVLVSPMVHTANNAMWQEGAGNLGSFGRLAMLGENCYAFSIYRDVPWESAAGTPVSNLSAAKLWLSPIASFKKIKWEKGDWVRVPISDVAFLESIRESDAPIITFGVWGTAGNGIYPISSNNTPWAPVLRLSLNTE